MPSSAAPPTPGSFTTAVATKGRTGFALASLLIGIGAFFVGLIPIVGALCGIAAIVLGIVALRKSQSKAMSVTGIVLGSLALLASIATTAGIGAAVTSGANSSPSAVAESPTAEPDRTEAPDQTQAPEPAATAQPDEEAAEPAAPEVPVEYASALVKAVSYSELMNMSKAGIFAQLSSEYGEKFSVEAAQYAVDTMQADWNANALAKAKTYQRDMAMSPEAIRDQLTSEYGEQFTPEQADFAIQNLNN